MLISLREVGHEFVSGHPLFSGLTMQLRAGDWVGIAGPSGSGKSTLLTILAGWTEPRLGTVERAPGATLTWVPQNPVGVHQRTALDHLSLACMLGGVSRRVAEHHAHAALERFGLDDAATRAMGSLSGGEAQRLMLARASLMSRGILLVDEPTAQLDRSSAQVVIDTLPSLARGGACVVVASHDPDLLAVCPRVVDLGGRT